MSLDPHRSTEKATTHKAHDGAIRTNDQSQPSKESLSVLTSSNNWHDASHSENMRAAANNALKRQNILPDTKIDGKEAASEAVLHAGQDAAEQAAKKDGKDLKTLGDDIKGRDAARTESSQRADQIQKNYQITRDVVAGMGDKDHPLNKGEVQAIADGRAKAMDSKGFHTNTTPEQRQAAKDLLKQWDSPEAKAMQSADKPGTFNDQSVKDGRSNLQSQSDKASKADADAQKALIEKQKSDENDGRTLAYAAKLSPEASKALQLKNGEGPYQVAQRMLGLDGQKHSAAEVMKLTRLIQQEAKAENGGKDVKAFKAGSAVIKDMDGLMAKVEHDAAEYKFASRH